MRGPVPGRHEHGQKTGSKRSRRRFERALGVRRESVERAFGSKLRLFCAGPGLIDVAETVHERAEPALVTQARCERRLETRRNDREGDRQLGAACERQEPIESGRVSDRVVVAPPEPERATALRRSAKGTVQG